MIFYKLINQRSLLEMIPKAFFNMSRSVSASFRRFSSSETLPASPSLERTPLPGKLLSPRSWYSLHQRYNSAGEMPNYHLHYKHPQVYETEKVSIKTFICPISKLGL